jgi:SOS-response transcriptional repressor LexA
MLNQVQFGRLGGVSKNTQLAYETGASPIPLDYLERLAEQGVDVPYVVLNQRTLSAVDGRTLAADGLADRRIPWRGAEPDPRHDADMVLVHQIDLSFGLGSAVMDTEIFEDQAEKLEFPRAWLRMITPSAPSQLCWARGKGDSMYPTIGDRDVILIDRSQRTLLDTDLIWAANYGDVAIVKRLRPMPDGGVKIMSDNESVRSETAYDGELNIFGRVIAVVRRL